MKPSVLPPLQSATPEARQEYLCNAAAIIAGAIQSRDCSILLVEGEDRIVLKATTSPERPVGFEYSISRGSPRSLAAFVAEHAKTVSIRSTEDSFRTAQETLKQYPGLQFQKHAGILDRQRIGPFVAAPIRNLLRQPTEVLGVLTAHRLQGDPVFSDTDLAAIEAFSNELGGILAANNNSESRAAESAEVYRSPIVRIELIKQINSEVMERLKKNPDEIHNLHHRAFEEFVAELLFRDGWKVDLSLPTCDGGFDVMAVRSINGVGIQLLVQAKKYRPDRPVGVSAIRELYTVKQRTHATKALLATTSYVSSAAKAEFRDVIPWELELREFQDLTTWLKGNS